MTSAQRGIDDFLPFAIPLSDRELANEVVQRDSTNARRFHFSVKQILLFIALISIGLAIGSVWLRKIVEVRPARPDDKLRRHYFGIQDGAVIRNVAIAQGGFTKSTSLFARLFAVRGGTARELQASRVCRSPNQLGGPVRQTLTLTLALGECDTPIGRETQLGIAGASRGGSSYSRVPVTIPAMFSQSFTGSITPGRDYIVYAEGDTEIDMSPEMTIQEFAQCNPSNYLVITVQLE